MQWNVDFIDNESSETQTAYFKTKLDAQNWIKNQNMQNRYDPTGFKVVDGPYLYKKNDIDYVNYQRDPDTPNVIILDRILQPDNEICFRSATDVIEYIIENGIDKNVSIDIAADSQRDESNLQLLEWLEDNSVEDIKIAIHGSYKPLIDNIKRIVQANKWKFVFSIFEEDDVSSELNENDKSEKKADTKDEIVAAIKKASKEFQKSASNYDPEKFAKIVVAFDDLAAGIGSYDFKKKRKFN